MEAGKFAVRTAPFWTLTRPAGWAVEVVMQGDGGSPVVGLMGQGPDELAKGAPIVLNSTPDDAVVSLDMTVLLMTFTANESTSEMPAPSQPATLLAMILLVTFTEYQFAGVVGKVSTSPPFTAWKRMPPPLPLSAALPIIRLALITKPGPTPSLGEMLLGGGTQSASVVVPHVGSTSGAPMTRIPPPFEAIVGLVLWLNRIALCSMSPK